MICFCNDTSGHVRSGSFIHSIRHPGFSSPLDYSTATICRLGFSVSLFYMGELRTNQCFMMLGALRTNRAGSGKLRTIRGRPARMTAGSGDVRLFWRRRPCGSRGCFLHCCSSLDRIFCVFHCTWWFFRNSPPCFSFR